MKDITHKLILNKRKLRYINDDVMQYIPSNYFVLKNRYLQIVHIFVS